MSGRFVLDSSVTMSWLFEEEPGSTTDRTLDLLRDRPAVVPALWRLEVANALLGAERRRRITSADAEIFLGLLERLEIEVRADAEAGIPRLMDLARSEGLTSFEACYLAIAAAEGLPLATLDSNLRKAARKIGVPLLTTRLALDP